MRAISISNIWDFFAGFAFVYFEDERDAEDAIRDLDNTPFGYDRRRLSVEWAKVCTGSVTYLLLSVIWFCFHVPG